MPRALAIRSTVLRLAVGYAALFAGLALVLAGYIYWRTESYLARQTDRAILAATETLLERHRAGGIQALIRAIETRLADEPDEDEIIALVDGARRIVAGNLESAPAETTLKWFELEILRKPASSTARVLRVPAGDTHALYVGRDIQVRLDVRTVVAETLLWSILLAFAASILIGLLARQMLARRLARISSVADRVVLGDLSPRVPLSGAGDEFDRLAADLNVMLDRLSELVDGVRQVSNAIAHDLRTPLTRLRLRAEAIPDPDERARACADIDEMERMVAETLSFARADALEARPERFDLAALVQSLVDDRSDLGADIAFDGPDTLAVEGRPGALRRAIANLVDNALAHGARARARLSAADGRVDFVVEDDGPGLPEDQLEKVFAPFYRVETSRSRDTGGVGLGLAVARDVARAHGGEVTLANMPGGGLRATLSLPAAA